MNTKTQTLKTELHKDSDGRTFKFLVVIKGKGTHREQRITTGVKLYWHPASGQWMSIPEN